MTWCNVNFESVFFLEEDERELKLHDVWNFMVEARSSGERENLAHH